MLKICYVFLGLICNFPTPDAQIIKPKIYNCSGPEVVLEAGKERGFTFIGQALIAADQEVSGQHSKPGQAYFPPVRDTFYGGIIIQVWEKNKTLYYVTFNKDSNGKYFCYRGESKVRPDWQQVTDILTKNGKL